MAFDAGMVACITHELKNVLCGGRVDKIHQPERDETDIFIRAGGKTLKLLISASSGSPRINISEQSKDNPSAPPAFCILLRKHLSGAKILDIYQREFERMTVIEFESRDEMGFVSKKKLICEIIGKFSNLILTEENGRIIGVAKPLDFTDSEKRQLLNGMIYEMPPKQDKQNPLEVTKTGFISAISGFEDMPCDKYIIRSYLGISPLIAREISYLASGSTDTPLGEIPAETLWAEFSKIINAIKNNEYSPCIIKIEGKMTEFSFVNIRQYGKSGEVIHFLSPSKMIEEFFITRDTAERVRSRAQDIFRTMTNAEHRLKKKIEIQKKELEECAEKEKFKEYADLITANLYAIKQGQSRVTLINYYSEDMEEVTLELDTRKTPVKNAQNYYKKYAKMKNAEVELARQIEIAEKELDYVYSVFDALGRASGANELEEIRAELSKTGYASRMKRRQMGSVKKAKPKLTEYETTNGYKVLCGKNNVQNDYLTFEVAEKLDYWFHVKNAPGSHVVLQCAGLPEPPAEDFTEAAIIAATNSSLAEGGGKNITVDYTLAKNIKKPPASKPGYVTYATNYAAYVTPDKELCKKLQK